jgi:predicted secreted hydrolase
MTSPLPFTPRARRVRAFLLGALFLGGLGWSAVWLATPRPPLASGGTLSAAAALAGADTAGYARAVEPRAFLFPDDHGPHPDFKTEWWYLTGHLEAEDGRSFGFQLTFFRSALAPEAPEGSSTWATNQLWMGHFALTDVTAGWHRGGERLARGAAGLAGGESAPFRIWLEDWELASLSGRPAEGGPEAVFPLRLQARHPAEGGRPAVALALTLEAGKPMVMQGDRGLSQKGPEPGNASYYLSWTRLPLQGTVEVDGVPLAVRGEGWMDREWSTSALDEAHTGWDWFSLQLEDGRELMFFELRRKDGQPEPLNHGLLVEADGRTRPLAAHEVELQVLDFWESPVDGVRYPSGWMARLPGEGLELRLTPRVRDQEMRVSVRYWEGALAVEGTQRGRPVRGRGYAELTGYADPPSDAEIPPGGQRTR